MALNRNLSACFSVIQNSMGSITFDSAQSPTRSWAKMNRSGPWPLGMAAEILSGKASYGTASSLIGGFLPRSSPFQRLTAASSALRSAAR